MLGILCEKPSAARNFAKALGGMSGSFDGVDYVIANARGHLYEFDDPSEMVAEDLKSKYKFWDLANLPWNEKDFRWSYRKKKDVNSVLSEIKSKFSKCDRIAISGDLDPTGEGFLLCYEVISQLKLNPSNGFCRFEFLDESPKEIQKGFRNLRPVPDINKDPEFLMSFYRCRWDFLSMQFTRVATQLSGTRDSLLREGRLKSAMIVIVGNQLKAISEYKKIPSYQNRFKDENGVVYIDKEEPTYPKREDVPQKYNPSDVVLDSKTIKHSAPPKLLDLAGLSSILAPKGLSPKQTLETYQKLYEAGICSYPRTEDKVVSPEQFNELLPLIDQIANLVGVDTSILTHRQPRASHVKAGGAHGANRPGLTVPSQLGDAFDAQYGKGATDIYTVLAKNYLSILGEDYEYEQQVGHVKDYPSFVGKANVPKSMGYKAIFSDEEPDEDENAKGLGTHADPFIHEGFPPKPQAPTMKWLMKQLEKRDVGTGATRTSTYAEITKPDSKNAKRFCQIFIDKKGKITMAQCGEMSYHLLPGTHIGSLDLTEQVQKEMKAVSRGEADPDQLLSNMQKLVVDDIAVMKENAVKMHDALGLPEGGVQQKEKVSGVYQPSGANVTFARVWSGHRFSDQEVEDLLAGKEITVMDFKNAQGKTWAGAGKLAEQDTKDGKRKYWGFMRTRYVDDPNDRTFVTGVFAPTGKEVRFRREFRKKELSEEMIKNLLAGNEVEVTGLVSKDGREYGVKAKLDNYEYNGKRYFGVVQTGFLDNKQSDADYAEGVFAPTGASIRFRRTTRGYTFTDQEVADLLAGKKVTATFISQKTNKPYEATGGLAEQTTDKGNKFWGFKPEFGNDVPSEWSGHKFTDEEKQILRDGGYVIAADCVSKKGKQYTAKFEWKDEGGRKRIVTTFPE